MTDSEYHNHAITLSGEMQISKYIEMMYNQKQHIMIGEDSQGNYLLHVGNSQAAEQDKTMLIPEDAFIGLVASAIIYFEHYGIDINAKVRQLIGSDSISYTFPLDNPQEGR